MTPTRQELTPALKTVRIDLKEGWGKGDLVGLSFPILTCRALTLRLSHDLTQRCAGYWLQVMAGMKDALPGPITHSVFASHG